MIKRLLIGCFTNLRKVFYILFYGITTLGYAQHDGDLSSRIVQSLNSNWKTTMLDTFPLSDDEFLKKYKIIGEWKAVSLPHNWDQYYGYRRASHGNLHGTAWYQKTLHLDIAHKNKQHFLFFEGVGSYAMVWVNDVFVGAHKGGRTTFTLDITDAVRFNQENTILVKADHPAYIADLPWVCGGCSGEWGFSEGSQPLGIHRPVSLLITDKVRIEPFGVHIWNDASTSKQKALLHLTTEIKNYGQLPKNIKIVNTLYDDKGNNISEVETQIEDLLSSKKISQTLPEIQNPKLWSPKHPYLYELSTKIYHQGRLLDQLSTPYGIRWVRWPVHSKTNDPRFFINDEPFFINGTCEYEHAIGKSHSFSDTEIKSRIAQLKAAGFNAFREGHQPHNLRYQEYLDQEGILFWSQFSAHIWYDTPEFKENFKTLLKEWIKERRNNPSVVMWGLQNESTLPKSFAQSCTQIIRALDPTSKNQRLVTTCNGGDGTDWNVVQNWSGTYGGDPYNYGEELKTQLLNGEYGAWRMADLHTEGSFDQKGIFSENRFTQLMEIKLGEAAAVQDHVVGQYQWLLYSHENPGRVQNGEGYRDIDRVGPVNYKGLFTIWGEPLDAFYMYRSNYAPKETQPMVYIVSHSWPNRWLRPGIKKTIEVYSNCDEVELFNDVGDISLGKIKNSNLKGQHFTWYDVDVQYNVLYAVGYVNGKPVAKDQIVLSNLPKAPNLDKWVSKKENILKPKSNLNYLYRVNCGGDDYLDSFGNLWQADVAKSAKNTWGSLSWTNNFNNLPTFYASQRTSFDPVDGTSDWKLFQDFRYGVNQLKYEFPVSNGQYTVALYFQEPWYGIGGGMDCTNWRVFDIAINGNVVEKKLDICTEAGTHTALKKTYKVDVTNGMITISFPDVASGQAVVSAIAIASTNNKVEPANPSPKSMFHVTANIPHEMASWMNITDKQYLDDSVRFTSLPHELYGADYLRFGNSSRKDISLSFISRDNAHIYVALDAKDSVLAGLQGFEKTENTLQNSSETLFHLYKKSVNKGEKVQLKHLNICDDCSMFTIATVPKYEMGQKDDRPTLKLEAENATTTGKGVEQSFFKKSEYIAFTENTKNSLTFVVKPGLANLYLMRFRYMNVSNAPIKVRLSIEDANGIIVNENEIEFPVQQQKWKVLNTTSGSFINAGTYKISISAKNMKGLNIDAFEFQ